MTLSLQLSLAFAAVAITTEAFVMDNTFFASPFQTRLCYQPGAMHPDGFEHDLHGPFGMYENQQTQGPPTAFREDFLQTADMRMNQQPTGGAFRPIGNDFSGMNDWNMPSGGAFEPPPMGMEMGMPFGQQFEDGLMPVGVSMQAPFDGPFPDMMEQGPGFMFPQEGGFPGPQFPGGYQPPFEQNERMHSFTLDGKRTKPTKKNIL